MADFGKTIPCWEVSSRSFLPLSAKGLRIEGSQGLPSRWVLLSVPCGELRIGRIQVNQSQQVLPWLSELALLTCTHLRQAKPPCPAVPPASYLWPGEGRETEAWKRNQKHSPCLEQGTFLCSHEITHPWQLPLPVPRLAVLTLLGSKQGAAFLALLPLLPPQLLPAQAGPRGTQHSLGPEMWAWNGSEHQPWHPNPFSRGSQLFVPPKGCSRLVAVHWQWEGHWPGLINHPWVSHC